MTVLVHRLLTALSGDLADGRLCVVELSAADLEVDVVARLLASVSAYDDGFPPLSAKGLAADARGRSGRVVRVWSAVRTDGAAQGLISLAEAAVSGKRRFSIPWLVVDPRDRRRGVATGLVRVALAAAAEAGATDVSVETLATWRAAAAFWAQLARRTAAEG
jgi:ribosomal protein S18 acetylase RimI-like enzyme